MTGHQGPGTLTDELIRDVLQLQGTMHPHQVISLEDLPGETSFALPDHYDHVHVGYHPLSRALRPAVRLAAEAEPVEAPDQAPRRRSKTPKCATDPSKYSLPDKQQASRCRRPTAGGTDSGD